jgi:rSAM/selenodomain-associated transferase 1
MSAIEPVAIAILAKAPIPGFAKTRLIPALGAEGAAMFQKALIDRAVETACAAATGPVTLWAAPDATHAAFAGRRARGVGLRQQIDGDLGARMLAALAAPGGPALVIGTDCPALSADDLRTAAAVLRGGTDAVVFPAEDGGYVLIGVRRPEALLFANMTWSTPQVMNETRRRLRQAKLTWQEPVTLWDVDLPEDLDRLRTSGLGELLP